MRWAARLLRPISRPTRRSARLTVHTLEDRAVPSAAGDDVVKPVDPTPVDVPVVKADPPADDAGTATDGKPDPVSADDEAVGADGMVKEVAWDGGPIPDGVFTADGPIMYSLASGEPRPPKPQVPYPQIGDRVWRDLNANGFQDAGEPGLPFVSVRLYQGDKLVGTTMTDGTGGYAFNVWNVTNGTADKGDDGLSAGTAYQIRVAGDQPALVGLRPTAPNTGTDELRDSDATATTAGATLDFTMGTDEIYYHYDLGYVPAATIGNLVWSDANNNGVKDKAEVGLAGVTVRLLDAAGKVEVATTTTGADGSYLFTGLLPGTYVVEIAKANFAAGAALSGLASSTGTPGQVIGPYERADSPAGDGKDHGMAADGAVRSKSVTVGAGSLDNRSVDFGFFRSGTLTGKVYLDVNSNGRIDFEDTAGLAGVKVTAAGPAGTFTATTDATGTYTFANLPAGTYTLTEGQPKGYASSTPNQLTAPIGPAAPATVNFGEARAADLEVKLTARPAVVNVGGLITLTYRVKNAGTLAATGVTLLMPLPAGLKVLGVDQTGMTFDPATHRATVGTLAAGAEAVVTIRVRATQPAAYRLTATVAGTAAEEQMGDNRSAAAVSVWPPVGPPVSPKPMSIMLASAFRR